MEIWNKKRLQNKKKIPKGEMKKEEKNKTSENK